MAMFDKDDILNAQAEGEMDTKYTPFPEGEYPAYIAKLDTRVVGENKDKVVLDLFWESDDAEVAKVTGMEKSQVRQSIFLDFTESGALDTSKGKNVQLGKLRDALGQNNPGQPWSPAMLEGAPAIIRVEHRQYEGNTYADVKGVRAIG